MRYEYFIAKGFISGGNKTGRFNKPVIRAAIFSVALGIAVMLIAVMIVTGFRNEISNKVTGFVSDIRLNIFDANTSYEESPLERSDKIEQGIKKIVGVKHIQAYATKAGILKTKTELQGIVLKGLSNDFDWSFFNDKIIEGDVLHLSKDSSSRKVIISKNIAQKLNLKLHDSFFVFFIQQGKKIRKFEISGIYDTGMSDDFDNIFILCDLRQIQSVNDWNANQIGGYEIAVKDFSKVDEVASNIYQQTGFQYNTKTAIESYPQIFNWLELQNINVAIIITLMILVTSISMISTLLILILENTTSVGLLKALGAQDKSLRKVFIYLAGYIVLQGVFWGNVIGLGLSFIQSHFHLIKLDQASYYMPFVPVNFTFISWFLINIGAILICLLMLIIPSAVIAKISPVKVLRFD